MRQRPFATAKRWAMLALVAVMGLAGSVSATLLGRGPDLVYDDVLNITWTRNANLPGSTSLRWADANAWAAGLVFGGEDDWRLPYASVSAGAGPITSLTFGQPCTGAGGADEVACRDDEMAYMFYYNLGGTFGNPKTGSQTAIGGEMLTGIQLVYWSGTDFGSGAAWFFAFGNGGQLAFVESSLSSAWAVRSGDVVAAPEPAALGLVSLGLAGLCF
jgi:hypothetical protein